jgi:aminodeoxyfutalosine deaminase
MGKKMSRQDSLYHRAGWVVTDSSTILENGFVKVEKGIITETGTGRIPLTEQVTDHGSGVIIPALINAHTHLELSGLKGMISFDKGFRHWVIRLIDERMKLDHNTMIESCLKGIHELRMSGCSAVGEISTLGLTRDLLSKSNMSGVWFREYLGNTKGSNISKEFRHICGKNDKISKNPALAESLAIHGPHTTAPDLMKQIQAIAAENNLPVSIHLAESTDEFEFITTGKGEWADFLSFRDIDFSEWGIPAKSPVQYLESIGALSENLLAVHLLHCNITDLEKLFKHRVHACLCPRSNQNLHGRLPDLDKMLNIGIKPCLGSDSLASCNSLSIFDEMTFMANTFSNIPPREFFDMGTINGAKALAAEHHLGSLVPGKFAAMIYIPINSGNQIQVLENIIFGKFNKSIKIVFPK